MITGNQYNAIPPANVNDMLLAREYSPLLSLLSLLSIYRDHNHKREKEGTYTHLGLGIPFSLFLQEVFQ